VLLHFSGVDGKDHSAVLRGCTAHAPACERDLFDARAILQILAGANRKTADQQLDSAKTLRKKLSSKGTPLDNFVELLLLALDNRNSDVFNVAREEYQVALSRDDAFLPMLDRIRQVYFGKGGDGGGLGGLLGSLLGGLGGQ
jgi:hypothetical protein